MNGLRRCGVDHGKKDITFSSPSFIYILENRTVFHAALKKEFSIIFFYFTLDETDKKYELIFFLR